MTVEGWDSSESRLRLQTLTRLRWVAVGGPAAGRAGGALPALPLAGLASPARRRAVAAMVADVPAERRGPLPATPAAEPHPPVTNVATGGPAATTVYLGYRTGSAIANALPEPLAKPAAAAIRTSTRRPRLTAPSFAYNLSPRKCSTRSWSPTAAR